MELTIIKVLQSGANKFLDDFFLFVTDMGDVVFFIAVFGVLFWAYNKDYAFRFSYYYLICYGLNSIIKSIFDRPRPWQADSQVVNYTNSSQSSFPSGHSASISVITTSLLLEQYSNKNAKKWQKIVGTIVGILACLIVAFSRMYLGQHFLTDVIAGLFIGLFVAFFAREIFRHIKDIYKISWYIVPIAFGLLFLYTTEMFTHNLSHAKVYSYIGLITSIIIGINLERKFVRFDVKANGLFNIFKVVFGLLSTYALYRLLDWILPNILIFKFITAFIVGFYITFGIMAFFKYFSNKLQIVYVPPVAKEKKIGEDNKKRKANI